MADFGEYKIVKTRKEHQCITCNRKIPRGKNAFNFKGMWEDDWQNWYMCIPCNELDVCGGEEEICGEEFHMWLLESEFAECPNCKGIDNERHLYHSDYQWDDKEETLHFTCELCDHEWEKFIGFDSMRKVKE